MSFVIVDVEADGPCPGAYSMIEIGAVVLGQHEDPEHGFHSTVRPITEQYVQEAMDVTGHTREECLEFTHPEQVMHEFKAWIEENASQGRPVFVSDNPAFDWQFVNFYFHVYLNENPFGFSARRIGDFAAGLEGDWYKHSKWKSRRKTKHTHNPLDDARGNAEALQSLLQSIK